MTTKKGNTMHTLKVQHPFTLCMSDGTMRAFTVGEHTVEADKLKNWFVQGCIQDGRAHVLPPVASHATPDTDNGSNDGTNGGKQEEKEPQAFTEAVLLALSNKKLQQMLRERGLTLPTSAQKMQLVAALLEAQVS